MPFESDLFSFEEKQEKLLFKHSIKPPTAASIYDHAMVF